MSPTPGLGPAQDPSKTLDMAASKELQDIIELLGNVTDAFTAGLFLYDEGGQKLRLAAVASLSSHLNKAVELAPGDGIVGWVAKTGQAVNISPFDQESRSLFLYTQDEAIKSFLAVPVGQSGVLMVDSKQSWVFTDKNQKILNGFAKVIGDLLETEKVKHREKDYARMLKLLYQVDQSVLEMNNPGPFLNQILSEARAFGRADLSFFTTPNRARTRYRIESVDGLTGSNLIGASYPLESGLVGWVYKENRRLVLNRVQERGKKSYLFSPEDPIRGFRTFVGLPLTLWGKVVGVMGLVTFSPRDWTADEIHVLAMTGRWVASALGTLTG